MKHLLAALASMAAALAAHAQSIDRVEPPFWWVGMKHRPLQLMLHGEGLSGMEARGQRAGVTGLRTTPLPTPHYLVVELDIALEAEPGAVSIELWRAGAPVIAQRYELRARAPGSAERQGFGPAD